MLQKLKTSLTITAARLTPFLIALMTFAFLVVAFGSRLAWAQESTGVDFGNEEAVAKLILDSVMNRQWGLLASVLLTLAVWVARTYVPETTVVGKWFRTKAGGVISAFGLALGGAFITQQLAGVPWSVTMVVKALSIAIGSSGVWSIVKNLREAASEKKAVEAGKEAEKAPGSTVNQ